MANSQIAEKLAEKIREVSIAEFFEKNRHLLGYENPVKSLFTVVKELVDNSIDACLEAGILPEIKVIVKQIGENRYRVRVEDNGPGVHPKKVPIAFGKFLVGSKFYRLRQSIGTQGIGAKGAILYAQLTTGKPTKIETSIGKEIHYFELMIDVLKNQPIILKHEIKENNNKWHGLKIELEVEGRYVEKRQSILEYLKLIYIANPYVSITFISPSGKHVFKRVMNELPKQPKEIKPHPYGVELGRLKRMLRLTPYDNILKFLMNEFSRIGINSALQILNLSILPSLKRRIFYAKEKTIEEFLVQTFPFLNKKIIDKVLEDLGINKNTKCEELKDKKEVLRKIEIKIAEHINPKKLSLEQIEKLHKAMQMVKLRAPPTDCLSPINEKYLIEALKKEFSNAEFYEAITRKPTVYRGYPFQVQAALVYGENLGISSAKIIRLANHTPLLYNQSDCVITKAITEVDWRNYGIQQQEKSIPQAPLIILVDFLSVWIPYKSEGKQAIAEYPEILKEIKLALQELGRKLKIYLNKKKKRLEKIKKKRILERYLPEVIRSISEITKKDEKEIKLLIENLIKKKVGENEL